jgi:hypothetical protein
LSKENISLPFKGQRVNKSSEDKCDMFLEKRRTLSRLYGVTTHETVLFIVTAVIALNIIGKCSLKSFEYSLVSCSWIYTRRDAVTTAGT